MKAETGILYIVATPIGNLDDLTPRALATLQMVDLIACEDTRHSQKLLSAFNIRKPLISLHQHNEQSATDKILQQLHLGQNVALISDAGTPLVSDPGAVLTRQAHAMGFRVSPIVGASSVMGALSASGLPADEFIFAGFIPSKLGEKERFLSEYQHETRTTVFFETPHRIMETLGLMQKLYPVERKLFIARELTKQFEETVLLNIHETLTWLSANEYREKGEFVLILEGAKEQALFWENMANDLYQEGLSIKTISQLIAKHYDANKKEVYDYLLSLKK